MQKRKATVTNWLDGRGYGFATDCENGEKIFLHRANVRSTPNEYIFLTVGEVISYLPAFNEKGMFAIAIEKVLKNEHFNSLPA